MNCESIEVGLYLPMPKQYVSMNCKEGEHEGKEKDQYTLTCVYSMAACDKALFNQQIMMVVVLNNKLN